MTAINDNDPLLDDPRLTAYALGELPETDRAAVESLLAGNAAARAFVDDVRAMSGALVGAYSAAPVPSLDDAHRSTIRAKAARPAPAGKGQVLRLSNWRVPATVAAAALVAVAFHGAFVPKAAERGTETASRDGITYTAAGGTSAEGDLRLAETTPMTEAAEAIAIEKMRTLDRPDVDGHGRIDVLTRNAPLRPAPDPVAANRNTKAPQAVRISGVPEPAGAPAGKPPSETERRVRRQAAALRSLGYAGGEKQQVIKTAKSPLYEMGGGGGGGGESAAGTDGYFGLARTESPASGIQIPGGTGGTYDPPGGEIRADHLQQLGQITHIEGATLTTNTFALLVTRDEATTARVVLERAGYIVPAPAPNFRRLAMKDGTFYDFELNTGALHVTERQDASRESYADLNDNPFTKVGDAALSTFGVDVDTASYANVRRILNAGQLPPPGAVRIEEMVNYFPYSYSAPTDGEPFAAHADVTGCPWDTSHRLVRIGIKGKDVAMKERPAANLVFLLDVSGSMAPENRLPLVRNAMKMLVEQLEAKDRISIVVYAGSSGLVLAPTAGDQKSVILAALDNLQAGGSTNGGAGIELAYKVAVESFTQGGINRVILATDGDFNVGVTDDSSLVRLIEEKAKQKVFLSVLGVGEGNLQDHKMEQLADKGNGNYAYLDGMREAKKVLVDQVSGTLQTIAKDLKVQVEFNPLRVASYRLIGYENRMLAAQDFADDKKDAGDVGAGHTVTALYELVPVTVSASEPTEGLRYQTGPQPSSAAHSGELLTVKMRWKAPEGDVSTLRERPVTDDATSYARSAPDLKFAAAVASFGMILRDSPHKGTATLAAVEELAGEGLGYDPGGHRAEFLDLVRKAKALKR